MVSWFNYSGLFKVMLIQTPRENPSAEGGEEYEGVDHQAVKVVDIVDTFKTQVCIHCCGNFSQFYC